MCIEHFGLYLACGEYTSQYLWGIFLFNFFHYCRSNTIHFRKLEIQQQKENKTIIFSSDIHTVSSLVVVLPELFLCIYSPYPK